MLDWILTRDGDNIIMKIQYRIRDNFIEIVRCFGRDSKVILPSVIAGLPVRRVVAYAFSDRKGREETDVLEFETKEQFLIQGEEQLLAGNKIKEVVFPDTVEEIGNYIFYGCKELLRLEFSDRLSYLGSGAFTGCGKLEKLIVHMRRGKKTCVKEILGELWQRIDVVFCSEEEGRIRLVFPEHYEEAVENTPARILFTQHHGTGNNYRQCFYDREMDYRKYDELFPLAKAQDKLEVLVDLVFCRLEKESELTEKNRQIYEDYIRENLREIAGYLIEKEELEWIQLISKLKLWSEEVLTEAIQEAAAAKKAELVGYLMNERHRLFEKLAGKERRSKRFEL